ncbi:MAG TPA: glycosyltransferase family 39 protein [Stellaceae bacterium]|nr:glycosyltransferase family 39 protein [Stellaceae bacterium]
MKTAVPVSAPAALDAEQRYRRIAAFTLLGVTLVRLFWLAGNPIDLYPDEAQYWLWSLHPALGYFSKPPLTPWIIRATTAAFGADEFGIRIASPVLHFLTGLVIFATARRLYDARIACWSAVVYVTLPAVSLSAAIISTDVPLLLCWAMALYAFVRAREERVGSAAWRRWWLAVGAAAGFGLLAKYAMAYWLLSALLLVLAVPGERRQLPGILGASALAVLVYLPNFWWNWTHGFVSYRHTEANANLTGSLIHPGHFLEFFSSQFGVFGPILFAALLALVILRPRRLAEPRARLLAIFALPSLAMMLVVSFLSRAHPNWAAPTYVSATILVVAFLAEKGRTLLLAASIGIHVAAAIFVVEAPAASAALGHPLPARFDLLHRVRGWHTLGRSVGDMLLRRPGVILLADSRETLAALIYYVRPHPFDAAIWNPGGGVRNGFEMTTDLNRLVGRDFLFVSESELPPQVTSRFAAVTAVSHITIPLDPDFARRYFLYDAKGFKGYR